MNLSICESGRSDVPDAPVGFCVANTMNGLGSTYVVPSTVTLLSSIASRRADWVREEARLSSSARNRLWKIAPGWYFMESVFLSYIEKPVMSEGSTSGVNWTLPKLSPIVFENAKAIVVFPTPGTSSIRMCPPARIAVSICDMT